LAKGKYAKGPLLGGRAFSGASLENTTLPHKGNQKRSTSGKSCTKVKKSLLRNLFLQKGDADDV